MNNIKTRLFYKTIIIYTLIPFILTLLYIILSALNLMPYRGTFFWYTTLSCFCFSIIIGSLSISIKHKSVIFLNVLIGSILAPFLVFHIVHPEIYSSGESSLGSLLGPPILAIPIGAVIAGITSTIIQSNLEINFKAKNNLILSNSETINLTKIIIKNLLIFGVTIIFIILMSSLVGLTFGWRPKVTTPSIEGVVKDSRTGKPLENIWLTATWNNKSLCSSGYNRKIFAEEDYLTDKNGKYSIPEKTSWYFPPLLLIGSIFKWSDISIKIYPSYNRAIFRRWIFSFGDGTIYDVVSLNEKNELIKRGANVIKEEMINKFQVKETIKIPKDKWNEKSKGINNWKDMPEVKELISKGLEVTYDSVIDQNNYYVYGGNKTFKICIKPSANGVIYFGPYLKEETELK